MHLLMASAAIPAVMSAVTDIPLVPKGSYRDGVGCWTIIWTCLINPKVWCFIHILPTGLFPAGLIKV